MNTLRQIALPIETRSMQLGTIAFAVLWIGQPFALANPLQTPIMELAAKVAHNRAPRAADTPAENRQEAPSARPTASNASPLLGPNEREDFRRRAGEAANAPDCSPEAVGFLNDAWNLMKAHPGDGEVAVVVAREALRLRHDDFAWQAVQVLGGAQSQREQFDALLSEDPDTASVLGTSCTAIRNAVTQLRSSGFEFGDADEGLARSRFRAAIIDAASLLSKLSWTPEDCDHSMGRLAVDTAGQLGEALAEILPWLGQRQFEQILANVLYTLSEHPLHDAVLESLLERMASARGTAPLKVFELELAERCRGRHARARSLARLATAPCSSHAESLRRAIEVVKELRLAGGEMQPTEYRHCTEQTVIEKDLSLCRELARAYVRIGAPVYPGIEAPFVGEVQPPRLATPPEQAPTSLPRQPAELQSPNLGLVSSEAQPSQIEPLYNIHELLFRKRELDLWGRSVVKALEEERARASGQPASTPSGKKPEAAHAGGGVMSTPRPTVGDAQPLASTLSKAEDAMLRGDRIAAEALLHEAFATAKALPANAPAMLGLRRLFDLTTRAGDLEFAEEVLDAAFTANPPHNPTVSRFRAVAAHALDDLVATLAEQLAGRGEPRKAACVVRKYIDRGASSSAFAGVARGRLNFAAVSRLAQNR